MRNQLVTHSRDAIFQALADPTRRAMLDLLRTGSLAAGEIAQSFPISRPAVSKHLRLLREAHLVHERCSGRNHFYHLNPEPLRTADRWLEPYRIFWPAKLEALKAFVESREANSSNSNPPKTSSRKKAKTPSSTEPKPAPRPKRRKP